MKALVKKWLALLLVAGMLLGGGGGLTAYAQQPAGADSQVQIEAAAGDDGETPAGSSLPENTAMEDTPAGESAADASVPADGTVAPDPGGVPDDSVADSLPDSSNALPEDGGAADGSLPDDSVADISDADNSSGTDTSELDGDAVETEEDSAVSEADADAAPADLNALLALAATDGAEVARLLNLYDDDDAYLAALKELLVFYYSLEEASDQQAPFLAGLDVRAEALAADFAAAAEERATDPYTLGYMPGEVLVQFRTYLSEARAEQTTETLDGSLEVVLLETGNRLTTVVDIPLWQTVAQAIEAFTADPNVVFAEPDYVLRLEDESNAEDVAADYAALLAPEENMAEEALSPEAAAAPNDPDSQWHHARINTTDAWALLPDQGAGNAVTVAVIDTMPDTAHEDLAGVFLTDHIQSFDRNGVTTTREAEPSPPASNRDHATMVSGIIAANANNSLGGYGIASGNDSAYNQTVKLMALDAQGDTSYSVSSMIQAINYAVTYEAQVINMSLGGVFAESSALTTAVKNAVTADIVVVNSAGNLNMDDTKYATDAYDSYYSSLSPAQNPPARTALHYPSDYDGVLGVIWLHSSAYAVGINPRYVGSTTYSGSNYGWRKEISAPGSLIYSTTSQNATKYREGSGSSYAAPMVAAVAALVRYANPALTAQQVMDILCATATDLHIPGRDRETGYGCVNAEAAVRMALATLPPENLATAGGHGQVALSWDAVPGADGYQVYAQAPGGSMALLETLPAGTTTCTHQNLAVAGSYQYQVAPLVNLTRQNVINKKLLYTDAATDQANIATEAVRIEGVAATAAMTVTVPATGVAVTPAASTLRLTQSLQLTATVSPAAASDKTVSWASTNTAVATVDSSGLLTAVSPGNAAIRATTTDGGFIADCTVTVVTPATGVALDKGSHTLVYPGTFQLTATVSPATATDKTVSWSSLSPAVATVSSSGVVTAVGPGN
ncbi:MAG: S8 family serine peptidase, partial [Ruminococcaceae bacterium]|nr:S8 family serine peptidase [Oscillospiraceae bacterium]